MTTIEMTTAERLSQGFAHQQNGQLDAAEECYLDVIAAEPENTEALKLLALVEVMRGGFENALNYAVAAVELAPQNGDYRHLLGRIKLDIGDADGALADLKQALFYGASEPLEVHLDIAAAHGHRGAWPESLQAAEAQIASYPEDVRALYAAATAAAAMDRHKEALIFFERGLKINPQESALWAGAAKARRALGDLGAAWMCAERALSLSPEDPSAHFMARVIRGEAVPAWHFNMMNDKIRNDAFKAALERRIKPGQLVLEIGTGAGLLALMSARAGGRVFTCESNSAVAMTAAGIISQNGYGDKIKVIDKPSWDVQVGVDIPEKADVLITEIFSASFLSEEVIPTIEDAKRRLLKPGATVIPASGSMVGALVSCQELAELTRVQAVEGFDFSSFNAFTPLVMNMDTPDYALDWLSDHVDLFTFDFQNNDVFPAEQALVAIEATKPGLCQGVVQWLRLDLDDETIYENPPGGPKATRTKHWTPLFYAFVAPRELKPGQTVTLRIGHDRQGTRIELVSID